MTASPGFLAGRSGAIPWQGPDGVRAGVFTTGRVHVVKAENAVEEYGFWIDAAVGRWKEHAEVYKKVGLRPILFVTAETTRHADAIGEYLTSGRSAPFKRDEVLIIHTDRQGDILQKDLDAARAAARDIDKPQSTIKAI